MGASIGREINRIPALAFPRRMFGALIKSVTIKLSGLHTYMSWKGRCV